MEWLQQCPEVRLIALEQLLRALAFCIIDYSQGLAIPGRTVVLDSHDNVHVSWSWLGCAL